MEHNEDYLNFINKFKAKKTKDDCYTPPAVYDAVLSYVKEKCDIEGLKVVRPFYPTGDYQKEDYTNCVVIDNPPFSIISEIIRFYNARKIKYFLFAPYLTLFGTNQDYTGIVTDSDIIYENGAKVKTSFVSNLFGDKKIIGCTDLAGRIKKAQEDEKPKKPCYQYPFNVVTSRDIVYLVNKGIDIEIDNKDVQFCRGLDSQKPFKKNIRFRFFSV